jgi:hypothetical protein
VGGSLQAIRADGMSCVGRVALSLALDGWSLERDDLLLLWSADRCLSVLPHFLDDFRCNGTIIIHVLAVIHSYDKKNNLIAIYMMQQIGSQLF